MAASSKISRLITARDDPPDNLQQALEVTRQANATNIALGIFNAMASNPQNSNCFLNVPQLIATYSLLANAADTKVANQLRNRLFGTEVVSRTAATEVANFLANWFKQLAPLCLKHFAARRILVHPDFTKSYSYATFLVLSDLGFQVKILKSPDVNEWLAAENIRPTSPPEVFMLWPESPEEQTKEPQKNKDELARIERSRRCPIITTASNLVIRLPDVNQNEMFRVPFEGLPVDVLAGEIRSFKADSVKLFQIDRHDVLTVPTVHDALTIYIIQKNMTELLASKAHFTELLRKLRLNTEVSKEYKSLILPVWDQPGRAANIAEAFQSELRDNPYIYNQLFVPGGFEDLAQPDSAPSSTLPPAIQHHDLFDIADLSRRKGSRPVPLPPVPADYTRYIVDHPFVIILIDKAINMPVQMGYISRPTPADRPRDDAAKKGLGCTIA